MTKPDILLQTAKDFEDWRNQRPHQSVPIPDPLRYRAIQLLETYSTTQVTRSLRLCGSQIKSWRKQFEHHSEEASEFIALPVVTEPPETSNLFEIELKLSEHTSLLMRGDVSVDLLRTLIQEARS
jgi:transposase-like protein